MKYSPMYYNQRLDFFNYYKALQEKVRGEILRESEEQIIGTDIEKLAKYFYDKYSLSLIEEDPEREVSFDVQDYLSTISAHQRERFYSQDGDLHDFQCQRVAVEVPMVSNEHILDISTLKTSTHSLSYSEADFSWGVDKITTSIETKGYGFEYDEDKIAQEVKQAFGRIRETIQWKNSDIEKGNCDLLAYIQQTINERKQKLTQSKEKLALLTKKIDIPMKKKPSASSQVVLVAHRPLVRRVKPNPTLPEEHVLDESKVDDIIDLLDNQAKNYEQTPRAVKDLGEENLRDLLLANLNSIFEGNATGETFSRNGKTDIYLKISKGNILICECKTWGGKVLYAETIDQLRGYLTWRHNYGVIIIFVRIKNFTKVLKESRVAIQAHYSYLNGFRKVNDTHFVSNHRLDDDEKTVKIHHLFYHLYL